MRPTYSISRALNFSHIDNRGIARPSALFDLMQDAATEHAFALHIDKYTLGILWVLSRMRLRQERPLYPGEPLRLETVFDGLKGVSWCRSFYFTDEAGARVASAASTWVMLDEQAHRILRPREVPAAAPFLMPPEEGFALPGKLACDTLTPHHIHTVRYSDLDVNNHLNNVKIVDLVADGLELDRRDGLFVSDIQVNYTAECRCGEDIALSAGRGGDGAFYVFGRVGDAVKFEAAARLSPYDRKD